jgi:hypothetical protein
LEPTKKPSATPTKPKPRGPKDIVLYFLLLPDTYRILIGTVMAIVLTPHLLPIDRTGMGRYVLFIMLTVIGWAVSGVPARWLTQRLQALIKSP